VKARIVLSFLFAIGLATPALAQFQTPGLGVPTAPTAPTGTNNEQIATTRFVKNALALATVDASHLIGVLPVNHGGTDCTAASGICLDNITGFSSTGLLARTGGGTYGFRTLTGTANEITATNGDGVSGNPTLSLPTALTFTGKAITGGTFNSPALVTPALGTPASGVMTNVTGTAAGLTAGHVTTNANLTGPITSSGNATAIASQTGTGSTFVMSAAPTITGTATFTNTIHIPNNVAIQWRNSANSADINAAFLDTFDTYQIGGGDPVHIASTTASTSATTGSLTLAGGLGAVGAGYFGGQLTVSSGTIPTATVRSGILLDGFYTTASSAQSIDFSVNSSGFKETRIVAALDAAATSTELAFYTNASVAAANGTEKMRIAGNGNVGIGTSTPGSYAGFTTLAINNASGSVIDLNANGTRVGSLIATTGGLNIATTIVGPIVFFTNSVEKARFDSAGNLGIGTATPLETLHVVGNIRNSALAGTGNRCVYANSSGNLAVEAGDCGTAGTGNVVDTLSATLAAGNDAGAQNITNIGNVGIGGTLSVTGITTFTGTAHFPNNVAIQHRNAANSADINTIYLDPSDVFQLGGGNAVHVASVTASTSSTTGAFTVAGGGGFGGALNVAGSVGIGIAPPAKLSVSNVTATGTVAPVLLLDSFYTAFSSVPTIDFTINGFTSFQVARIGAAIDGAVAGNLVFSTASANATSTVATEKMRILANGNVGIGTAAPAYKLEVSGTLGVSGIATFLSTVHLPNNVAIQARNAANSGDVNVIYIDGSDAFQLGGGNTVNVASVTASTVTTDGALTVQGGIGSGGLVNAVGFGAFAGTNSRLSITSNFSLSDGILLNVLNAAASANKGLEVRATTAIFPITTLFGIDTATPGSIGTGTGIAFGLDAGVTKVNVTPYVDTNLTRSAFVVQTVDQPAVNTNGGTGYEYAVVGGIKSTHNDGSLGPNKVAVAGMATMSGATSGNGWGGYFLCGLESGSRVGSICVGTEIDVNNQTTTDHNYGNLGTPAYGLQITGTSIKQNTAALLISGAPSAPQWYAGIVFNNFRSTHSDYGIDFAFDASTTFGQSAIRLPNNQTIAWKNAAGGNINALYLDGSDIFQLGGGDPVAVASTLNVVGGYKSNGTAGVSCSGTPTSSFATVNGIVTHC
jgi:hypothetical protein